MPGIIAHNIDDELAKLSTNLRKKSRFELPEIFRR
jgi:hypothetical protein